MKWLILLLLPLPLLACAPSKQIDLEIINSTPHPITIHAESGVWATTIPLMPGQPWYGWIPRVMARKVRIEVGR